MRIVPKNWDKFQQYKDRKPQWIKLQRDLLNDFSYASVQIGTKATLPLLWLLSSEYDQGIIDASIEEISFRIHIDQKTVSKAIEELINRGFYYDLDASVQNCTEPYIMVPREEESRGEGEKEEDGTSPFKKPTIQQLQAKITENNYNVDPERFYNHYESNGWKVGKNKMKSWVSALANWHKTANDRQQPKSFKAQDAQRTDDAVDAFLQARANGFDLRNLGGDDMQDVEVMER